MAPLYDRPLTQRAPPDEAPGSCCHDGTMTQEAMSALAREIEEFVGSSGWDQAPQLFALVPTSLLLQQQPELSAQLNPDSALTPVAQDSLPKGDLAEALSSITWPDAVMGCALAQEIVVLPPSAEAELPAENSTDVSTLQEIAANHPDRTEARLVVTAHRDGSTACLMRIRTDLFDGTLEEELIERPDLAPRLSEALRATFAP